MTVRTAVVQTFLKEYNLPFVPLNNGLQLQVLRNIGDLSACKKHHYAAFIKDVGMLVVWEVSYLWWSEIASAADQLPLG